MNQFATKTQGRKATWGLRLSSLAVAGLALAVVQSPLSPAVADDEPVGAQIQIVQHTENPWTAGTTSFIDELVNYQDVDLPLAVTVDWGDGYDDTGRFDAAPFSSKDDMLAMYPLWDEDPVVPGDQEMELYAAHTYAQPGTYLLTVTVVDNQGERFQAVQSLEVKGVATPVDGQAEQEVSFQKLDDRVYGDDFYIRATGGGSGNPVVISSNTPAVCRAEGSNGMRIHLVGVGTCIVEAHQAGGPGYLEGSWYDGFAVEPAPLRITAKDVQRASYEKDPSFTFTYEGLVNGDTPAVVSGLRAELYNSAFRVDGIAHDKPGTYVIRPAGARAANYQVKLLDGTLTVNPAVRVTANGISDDLRRRVVKINGEWVTTPYLGSVPFGSQLSVQVARLALDVPSGELYVTTGISGGDANLRHDTAWYVSYHTIPGLIDTAALASNSLAVTRLKAKWEKAQLALTMAAGGLDPLRYFADTVRESSGFVLSAAGANVLLDYLQVVYATYGGRGVV